MKGRFGAKGAVFVMVAVLVFSGVLPFMHMIASANDPPVADIGGPYSGYVGTGILFILHNSYDPDGYIVQFTLDVGDGHSYTFDGPPADVMYTYRKAGVYTATLTVVDNEGATDTDTTTVTVTVNKPPVADAGGPYTGKAGESITFYGSNSYDPDGKIVKYEWDFGDGSGATGEIVKHTYSKSGIHTATLTVYDDAGAKDTDRAKVILSYNKDSYGYLTLKEIIKSIFEYEIYNTYLTLSKNIQYYFINPFHFNNFAISFATLTLL